MTKTIFANHRNWKTKLPEALWAYGTIWHNTTGHSTYYLVFGKEAIFPIEFEINILKTSKEVELDFTKA